MTIKEVELEIGVPRATIRYYEKEKLIAPQRGGNGYREYSETDVETLKQIIIMRKLGMSVSDIANVFEGTQSLAGAAGRNVIQLQQEIEELRGAIRLCKRIQEHQEELAAFDTEFYWAQIHQEETKGNRFLNITGDVVQVEKKLVWKYFDLADEEGNLLYNLREAVLRVLGLCVFLGIVEMVLNREAGIRSFLTGFSFPLVTVLIYSAWELPLYFLAKRHSGLAGKLRKVGRWICILLFVAIVVFAVVYQLI